MENILENIKESFINNTIIENDLLLKYIIFRIYELKINNNIQCVCVSNRNSSEYVPLNGRINLNPNEIFQTDKGAIKIDKIINKYELKTQRVKNNNKINIYNIFSINHELYHPYQEKYYTKDIILDSDNFDAWYTAIIQKSLLIDIIDENIFENYYYNKFHNYFYCEYNANILSFIETLKFINSFDIKELNKLIILFNKLLAQTIIESYTDILNKKKYSTPYNNMIFMYNELKSILTKEDIEYEIIKKMNNIFKILKDVKKPYNQIERLKLGLNINEKTYHYILDISKGKNKTLNLFNDIYNIN